MLLRDQLAVVAGPSRGIGAAIARLLARPCRSPAGSRWSEPPSDAYRSKDGETRLTATPCRVNRLVTNS